MSYSREPSSSHQSFHYNNQHNMSSSNQYNMMSQSQFQPFDTRHHAFNLKSEDQMYPPTPSPAQIMNGMHANNGNAITHHAAQMSISEPHANEYNMQQRFIPHGFHNQHLVEQPPSHNFNSVPNHPPSHLQYSDIPEPKFAPAGAGSPNTTMMHYGPNLRFQVNLEAQTAAAQKSEEVTLTYLNKGQYYPVSISDREKYDGNITTTITLMFYDDAHRRMAGTYWGFWLSQQPIPRTAKALTMDKNGSTGASEIDMKAFDRVTFNWNGRKGVRVLIKFNCLSTDFSRIKGVKGIPMRIHVTSKIHPSNEVIERCFSKIKLFRDKGAERKNKDDQRHLEKIWEKMKGKSMEENPLISMYTPVSPVTEFRECVYSAEVGDSEKEYVFPPTEEDLESQSQVGQMLENGLIKERKFDTLSGTDIPDLVDVDPTYIPHLRKHKPLLCLFVKLLNEQVYRAIYLEKLTVVELIEKLAAKLQLQPTAITGITRMTSKGLSVQVDDAMITQMVDEMDIIVECSFSPDSGSTKMALILKF